MNIIEKYRLLRVTYKATMDEDMEWGTLGEKVSQKTTWLQIMYWKLKRGLKKKKNMKKERVG